uniref:Nematode cuticle collagen N-terminal domain-containing protein n=1 Tax=Parascaris equorum TaxID=6256 RepID=A0A914RFN2_PAREQ
MPPSMERKESDEHRHMRRIAFVAIVVSTAAVIASVVTLPMLYSYVQSFQSHLIIEADYCKVSFISAPAIALSPPLIGCK